MVERQAVRLITAEKGDPAFKRTGDDCMTHRIGRKGQVVIPKAPWQTMSLEPGDEVTVSRDGNSVRVERVASPDRLSRRIASSLTPPNMAERIFRRDSDYLADFVYGQPSL